MRSGLSPSVGRMFSVEWNQNVAAVQSQLLPATNHFVLPDLPDIVSDQDRTDFLSSTDSFQRIHTVAACHHETADSLLKSVSYVEPNSKLLLVGGNKHGPNTMSSMEAAMILRNEKENTLWGVTNPNDPNSLERLEKKVESGMTGFITQPLLSSRAMKSMEDYRSYTSTDTTILAGLAFPKTVKGLRFWAKLLGQEEELEKDPLFLSHLAYFSQPYVTPIAWIGRELQDMLVSTNSDNPAIDGVHFMPLANTKDLCTIFKSLNNMHQSFPED